MKTWKNLKSKVNIKSRFEEEILNLNSSKIEEELKKNRMDVSKLEDLNLGNSLVYHQRAVYWTSNLLLLYLKPVRNLKVWETS
jgi:hypothetical protein